MAKPKRTKRGTVCPSCGQIRGLKPRARVCTTCAKRKVPPLARFHAARELVPPLVGAQPTNGSRPKAKLSLVWTGAYQAPPLRQSRAKGFGLLRRLIRAIKRAVWP